MDVVPQARVERRVSVGSASTLLLQGGIMDPLTGDVPYLQYFRFLKPENSPGNRRTQVASHGTGKCGGGDLTVGAGGYYSRQHWGFNRSSDAWAGTSDWTVPFNSRWKFQASSITAVASAAWAAASAEHSFVGLHHGCRHHNSPIEFNGRLDSGQASTDREAGVERSLRLDNVRSRDLRRFPIAVQPYYDPTIGRNRSSFVNFIYRPRSDVLMSVEYRRFRTFRIYGESESADH
jgi:hypothetical protein